MLYLASLEKQQDRDIANSEPIRNFWISIHVDLYDPNLVSLFHSNLVQHRSDHPTRTTPARPKIDENWDAGFPNTVIEVHPIQITYTTLSHNLLFLSLSDPP